VNRNLHFHPRIVEVSPDRNLILDPLLPLFAIADEVALDDRAVMRAGAIHVEQTDYAVEWGAD